MKQPLETKESPTRKIPPVRVKKLPPGNAYGCFDYFHTQFDPRLRLARRLNLNLTGSFRVQVSSYN